MEREWGNAGYADVLRTWSKLILMLPTFVAPTGTMLKKPCFHRPSSATRSFSTNRFSSRFAIHGETEKRSPVYSKVSNPSVTDNGRHTNKVPSALNDPCSRTVEPVIVSRRQINDDEERVVPRFGPHARETVPPCGSRTDADLSRHAHVLGNSLRQTLVPGHRRVLALPMLLRSMTSARGRVRVRRGSVHSRSRRARGRWGGRAEQLMQTILNAVDLGKVTVVDLMHGILGELDGGRGGSAWARDTKEGVEGVCTTFDLLDASVFDDTEVEHATICWAHLRTGHDEQRSNKMTERTHQDCISDRAHAILELAVEEVTETCVPLEIVGVDFLDVAAENAGVYTETDGAKPDGELKGVKVAPKPRHIPKREGADDMNLGGED